MANENGTGIIYPTITLGGIEYTVKFTRGGIVYRMSKAGVSISELGNPKTSFGALVDILHAALPDYKGMNEDLANLVLSEDKAGEASRLIAEALGKVFPPSQAARTADRAEPQIQ